MFKKIYNWAFKKSYAPNQPIRLIENQVLATLFTINARPLDITMALKMYNSFDSVRTSIDLILSKITQITPIVKRKDGSYTHDSELLDGLNNFNEYYSSFNGLLRDLARDVLLFGGCYIFTGGSKNGAPVLIDRIAPDLPVLTSDNTDNLNRPLQLTINQGGYKGEYTTTPKKTSSMFDKGQLSKVTICRKNSDFNGFSFESPLTAVADQIKLALASLNYNSSILSNGGNPSMIYVFRDNEAMTAEEMDKRTERIRDSYAGSRNAGKIMAIAGDIEVITTGTQLKDLDFENLLTMISNHVYLTYHIPLAKIDNSKSTLNNGTTAVFSLYNDAVFPVVSYIFEALTQIMTWYLPDFKGDIITYDKRNITDLEEYNTDIISKLASAGIHKVNELRALIPELDSVPEGNYILRRLSDGPLGKDGIVGSISNNGV